MKIKSRILITCLIIFAFNIFGQADTISRNRTISETDDDVSFSIAKLDTLLEFILTEASNTSASLSNSSILGWSVDVITAFGDCDSNGKAKYTYTFTGEETADQMFPARVSGEFTYCGGTGTTAPLSFSYTLDGSHHIYYEIDPPESVIGVGETITLSARYLDFNDETLSVDWSASDNTGVTLSSTTGESVDVTGEKVGNYTVGGSKTIDGSTQTESSEVDVVTFDLVATDDNTHGDNNIRQAGDGQTLWLVVEDSVSYESATATASMDQSYSFRSGEPSWSGDASAISGSLSAIVSENEGVYDVTATAWGDDKTINILVAGRNQHDFTVFPGANALASILGTLSSTTSFPGTQATFTVAVDDPTITGYRYTVEKPNSPDKTFSKGGEFSIGGSVTGEITHPTFSGSFPPEWAPGDPLALWEVYAKASIDLSINANVTFENEYEPKKTDFGGSGNLTGTVEAGVYAFCDFGGYNVEGMASASAGVSIEFTLEGELPNKTLNGKVKILPVTLNAELKLYRESDGYVRARKALSYAIWDGWEQEESTVLIGQPAG